MRRIDKRKILSSIYKKWLDKLNSDKKKHPRYSNTYYTDVVANLLHCQKGVCAYTEMIVCNPEQVKENHWNGGRYIAKKIAKLGDLEHFEPRLKEDRFWEWDNLFVIHPTINVIKRDNDVDDILKPDSPGYNPFELLEYNERTHHFKHHPGIEDEDVKKRIKQMLKVLQVNHDTVCYERETYLNRMAMNRMLEQDIKPDRFFTACEMVEKKRRVCDD